MKWEAPTEVGGVFNRDVSMPNYNLTIEDLEQQTGLTRKYIDRCYARFGSLLAGYRKQSPDQNKYLYDGNAVAVFLQVKDFKEGQGMKLPEIRDRISEELGRRTANVGNDREVVENELESSPSGAASADTTTLIAALKDAYEMAITSERGKVLLLEESLELRKQREQEHLDKIARFQATTTRRGVLLSRLEDLDGKLFSMKKKRAIIQEIRTIDSQAQIGSARRVSVDDAENPVGEN